MNVDRAQIDYPTRDLTLTRAVRPIFGPCRTHSLTRYESPLTIPTMRRTAVLLALFSLLAAVPTATAAVRSDSSLEHRLAKALRVPHVAPSRSAALAFDLETGKQLFAQHDSLPLVPASNEKLALTFALLTSFSPMLRIETRVEATGTQNGTVLHGNLVLVGGGDPTLTSNDLARLARRVRAAGIRQVTGGVIGDESLFDRKRTCPGWKPSFAMTESAPLSALVVDRARYRNYLARLPAKAAALLFRDALRAADVSVDDGVAVGKSPGDAIFVARTRSAPLASIVRFMDLRSDNFTAEQLLKFLGLTLAERGTSAAGAQAIVRSLVEAGIPTAGIRILDGSGLSQGDRLTVGTLVGILQAFHADPALEKVLVHALPVAGVSGTLRDRMRTPALLGHVLAKTGTTSIASSLSGYVNSRIAFAIIQNGDPISYWWAREAQDRFATVLAKTP
jgi:D-alanyl-D-alanine carboxypeptidase/D-alanyl-D-alanine-endopeptidase (penicillin-binding protein 4)